MDSIKKKMQSLANETASAVMKFEKWEKELNRINENADSLEEQVSRVILRFMAKHKCTHS